MMSLTRSAALALVAVLGLHLPFSPALAQDNGETTADAETGGEDDGEEGGFWDRIDENITVEYPGADSSGRIDPDGGGGGGDAGGGGGHSG